MVALDPPGEPLTVPLGEAKVLEESLDVPLDEVDKEELLLLEGPTDSDGPLEAPELPTVLELAELVGAGAAGDAGLDEHPPVRRAERRRGTANALSRAGSSALDQGPSIIRTFMLHPEVCCVPAVGGWRRPTFEAGRRSTSLAGTKAQVIHLYPRGRNPAHGRPSRGGDAWKPLGDCTVRATVGRPSGGGDAWKPLGDCRRVQRSGAPPAVAMRGSPSAIARCAQRSGAPPAVAMRGNPSAIARVLNGRLVPSRQIVPVSAEDVARF
ncbi:MAG: hypothetical protein ABSC94_11705 [Polyangiaceae bacterium]